jgi:hypothetical protein
VGNFQITQLRAAAKASTPDAFLQQYSDDWLLWDTSVFQPSLARADPTVGTGRGPQAPSSPLVCIALTLLPGQTQLVLGRSVKCDLSINDSTLSARHLLFSRQGESWQVADLRSSNGSLLDDVPLESAVPVALKNGAVLLAGDVRLTVHTGAGLYAMLAR